MIGRKLVAGLALDGTLGSRPVSQLSLVDLIEPEVPHEATCNVETSAADLSLTGAADDLVESRPDVVFHLAAVVSAESEADLEKGYRVNLDGTRLLFDAMRAQSGGGYQPRVVYASSIAVFGSPFPDVIGDDERRAPLTSYGTQKAMAELLLADYSRRGYLDGIALRLPTICVRPGPPNLAASGFFSSIIREPLNGQEAVLPVPEDVRHWFASPRAAVGFFLHAAALDRAAIAERRALTMPGVSATVAEQLDALRAVAGPGVDSLIRRERDETIAQIVAGWPRAFDTRSATALGFKAEADFDQILRVYVEDELGGRTGALAR